MFNTNKVVRDLENRTFINFVQCITIVLVRLPATKKIHMCAVGMTTKKACVAVRNKAQISESIVKF